MEELISVIIPVYRVEKYIQRCLESVCNQSYKNLEIILVDDGSDDGCPEICDEYAAKDTRIKVIHKRNQGLSAARNDGMKLAKGSYIAFVDSDDWIDPDMYEIMLKICKEENADIAVCGLRWVFDQGTIIKGNDNKYICDNKTAIRHNLYQERNFINAATNKMFKKEVITGLEFPIGKFYEDFIFVIKAFAQSRTCVDIGLPKYNYFRRADSIMGRGIVEEHIYDLLELYDAEVAFLYEKGFTEEGIICRQRYFSEMIKYRFIVQSTRGLKNKKQHLRWIENRIRNYARKIKGTELKGTRRILYTLYRINPILSYIAMAIVYSIQIKMAKTW